MPKAIKAVKAEEKLIQELKELSQEIRKLKDQEFIQVFKKPWKFLWFSFLKGLIVGFGSILGASVLVGLFVYLLAQISLVPILGDFVEDIMSQIQLEKSNS
ncbi:hypothetical protein HY605_04875 [Candidatus Peregrinibacteria bacterium]|nr:hypothetical protein [Candidatus Peregrinibacteria bacterium]